MTPQELDQLFETKFIIFDDESYAIATKKWLLETYATYFRHVLATLEIAEWRPNFDCENWAGLYRIFAQLCHAKSKKRNEQSIAVGEIHYTKSNGTRHAINCAVVEKKELIYIEPQTQKRIWLSSNEYSSVSFARW